MFKNHHPRPLVMATACSWALAAALTFGCAPAPAPVEETGGTGTPSEAASPSPVPAARQAPAPESAPTKPATPATANLPGGSQMEVMLDSDVSSADALAGDAVSGHLVDAAQVNGRTVIPAGSPVEGVVAEVKSARRFGGQAMVKVDWIAVALPGGGSLAISGSMLAEAKGTTKQDTAIIAGSAVGGALLGKVLGDDSKDAAIGAAVGGGVGTAVAARKGDEALLAAQTTTPVVTLAPADLRLP